eukprot:m.50018 g.50018  ORF g.50018 m.50018 type:complete len:607 (-) comp7487_c0_seq1:85-1905(-)
MFICNKIDLSRQQVTMPPRGGNKKKQKHKRTKGHRNQQKKADPNEPLRKHIQDINVQLSDLVPQTRYLGLNSLAHVLADPANHRIALSYSIVNQLLHNLRNTEDHGILCEVVGCFRNLANNSELVGSVFSEEVTVELLKLFNKCAQSVNNFHQGAEGVDEAEASAFFGVLTQSLKTTSLLSECEPAYVEAFCSQQENLTSLISCLRVGDLPPSLVATAAETLLVLSEDNPMVTNYIESVEGVREGLFQILSLQQQTAFDTETVVSIAGSILNCSVVVDEAKFVQLVKLLVDVVAMDIFSEFHGIIGKLPLAQKAEDDGRETKELMCVNNARSLAKAIRIAIELLSNLLTKDSNNPNDLSIYLSAFQDAQVLQTTLSRCQSIPVEIVSSFDRFGEWGKVLLVSLRQIGLVALGFVTNYATTMSLVSGASVGMGEAVTPLLDMMASSTSMDDLEDIVNCLWAMLRENVSNDDVKQNFEFPDGNIDLLIEGASNEENEGLRVACVGLLGCIGQLAHHFQRLVDFARVFIQLASSDQSFWVRAEASNSIFDTLAEPETNDVCAEGGLDESTLGKILKGMKIKEGMDEELIERIEETRENLVNFIDYKRNQ